MFDNSVNEDKKLTKMFYLDNLFKNNINVKKAQKKIKKL